MSSSNNLVSRLKETARSIAAIRRPWRDFLDLTALGFPFSLSEATTRITQNLTHFRVNYIFILLLILFLSLIFRPISLIIFLITLLGWLVLYFAREEPLVVMGFEIGDRVVVQVLLVFTVVALSFTGAWVNVLAAAAIGVALVILHAGLRTTDDLVMDDLESPYGHVLADGDDEELDSPRGDYSGI